MTKVSGVKALTLNREFAVRYAGVALLFAVLAGWFGYDGLVRYPQTEPAVLYRALEKSDPPAAMTESDLLRFRSLKCETQGLLAAALGVGAVLVFLVLLRAARFHFSWDADGFTWNGRRYAFSDIASVDGRDWNRKGLLRLRVAGRVCTLDAWHHAGVADFHRVLRV